MRSGGRRASATAATSAPAGVGGFAAAPGAGPVPSGGGCRLGDDPPGHAEAAAAAARVCTSESNYLVLIALDREFSVCERCQVDILEIETLCECDIAIMSASHIFLFVLWS
ncbi:hypothetical protein MJT46_001504 [Ovis ammon polii x Ovis aries]|uniref:Uncharacterized protein n=1 Tax=Ovis aries TaxID=9940 RepID=A0A836ALC3_SHEEP|nr:hypothetical protein JEQ12_000330 [Ovis aries]KAI4580136.1 hypothetical protein MJT46_001504 [Ovis ammon polii x Ovis aries]